MVLDSKRAKAMARLSAKVRRKKARERKRKEQHATKAKELHRRGMTIIQAMRLWPEFKAKTWGPWKAFLKALFGLGLTATERETFEQYTKRSPSGQAAKEAWLVVGRRGGKSKIAGLTAVYLAAFRDWSKTLTTGERGTIMVLASDRAQARTVFSYIVGLLKAVPFLDELIENERKDSLDLKNGVSIEVHTASYKSVRGYTLLACICDEIAFWRDESSTNPDSEVIAALRPAMSTVPDSVLLAISTPYWRRGALWNAYNTHYGRDTPRIIVWQASTLEMNAAVPEGIITQAYEDDEVWASAEYGAQFRRDLESFVSPDVVDAGIVPGRYELAPLPGARYVAFVDPSGGSHDSFTLAIAHQEDRKVIVDCIREAKAPFKPSTVVEEFCEVLGGYRVRQVQGDRYASEWPREAFQKHGVQYRPADMTKNELYLALLPALNSGKVELLDVRALRGQLLGLERRKARSGRESIDHGPHGRDDVANAVAGVVAMAVGPVSRVRIGTYQVSGGAMVLSFGKGTCGTCWECRHRTGKPCAVTGNDP